MTGDGVYLLGCQCEGIHLGVGEDEAKHFSISAFDGGSRRVREVGAEHRYFDLGIFAICHSSEVVDIISKRRCQHRVFAWWRKYASFFSPFSGLHSAPDIFHHVGMVNERVAVALVVVDGLVAVEFFLAHRVVAVPIEEHFDGPVLEGGVCAVGCGQ